MIDDLDHKLNS